MECSSERTPPTTGASPRRKLRKKRGDSPPATTPSKLRSVIKPSSRGNGDFAASATRRRGENQGKESRANPSLSLALPDPAKTALNDDIQDRTYSEVSSAGTLKRPVIAEGYQLHMPAPSADERRQSLGVSTGFTFVSSVNRPNMRQSLARRNPKEI